MAARRSMAVMRLPCVPARSSAGVCKEYDCGAPKRRNRSVDDQQAVVGPHLVDVLDHGVSRAARAAIGIVHQHAARIVDRCVRAGRPPAASSQRSTRVRQSGREASRTHVTAIGRQRADQHDLADRRAASAPGTARPCRAAGWHRRISRRASGASCGQHHRFTQSKSLKSKRMRRLLAGSARAPSRQHLAVGSPLPDTFSANGKRAMSLRRGADRQHAEHLHDARFDGRCLHHLAVDRGGDGAVLHDGLRLGPVFLLASVGRVPESRRS